MAAVGSELDVRKASVDGDAKMGAEDEKVGV